jgi:hypothetical protein
VGTVVGCLAEGMAVKGERVAAQALKRSVKLRSRRDRFIDRDSVKRGGRGYGETTAAREYFAVVGESRLRRAKFKAWAVK